MHLLNAQQNTFLLPQDGLTARHHDFVLVGNGGSGTNNVFELPDSS
jgi:hypothetical protein